MPVEPESDSKHFSVIREPSYPQGIRFKQRRVSSIIAAMFPSLPKMFHLSQRYPASRSLDVGAILREGFDRKSLGPEIHPGMRVAVGMLRCMYRSTLGN